MGIVVMAAGFTIHTWLGVDFQGADGTKLLLRFGVLALMWELVARLGLTNHPSVFIRKNWRDTLVLNGALLFFIVLPFFIWTIQPDQGRTDIQNLLINLIILFGGGILSFMVILKFGSEALWPDFINRSIEREKKE